MIGGSGAGSRRPKNIRIRRIRIWILIRIRNTGGNEDAFLNFRKNREMLQMHNFLAKIFLTFFSRNSTNVRENHISQKNLYKCSTLPPAIYLQQKVVHFYLLNIISLCFLILNSGARQNFNFHYIFVSTPAFIINYFGIRLQSN